MIPTNRKVMNTSSKFFLSFLLLLQSFITLVATRKLVAKSHRPFNNSISALFIFGDSTVDSGNNNYNLNTIFRSNFPPYGIDFINQIPTGRFTNGRLVTDFIVSYIGIKETVPAYLDPELNIQDLLTGVSFASGGTGIDSFTAQISIVISLEDQLIYFREYKAKIKEAVGKEEANLVINKAIFLLSAGTNDFVVNYFGINSDRRITYTISSYQRLLFQNMQQIIQSLVGEGVKKLVVAGLPPIGCLPIIITVNDVLQGTVHRQCRNDLNLIAIDYNKQLQKLLKTLGKRFPSTKLVYVNIYEPLNDMIQNPDKYGFEDVKTGCCGTGLIEGAILCNPMTFVCIDSSKNMFWDSIHPSQAAYNYLFNDLRPVVDFLLIDIHRKC